MKALSKMIDKKELLQKIDSAIETALKDDDALAAMSTRIFDTFHDSMGDGLFGVGPEKEGRQD